MKKKIIDVIILVVLCIIYIFFLVLYFEYYIYSKQGKLLVMFIVNLVVNLLIGFVTKKTLAITFLLVTTSNLLFTGIILLLFNRNMIFLVNKFDVLMKNIFFNFISFSLNGNWLIPFILRKIRILRERSIIPRAQ